MLSSLLCPLCAQTTFSSIDALRHCLIKIANGPLTCPICQGQFLGLDKLTIHLFSHNDSAMTTATEVLAAPAAPAATTTTTNYNPITAITVNNGNNEDLTGKAISNSNSFHLAKNTEKASTSLPINSENKNYQVPEIEAQMMMTPTMESFENTHHSNIINKRLEYENGNEHKNLTRNMQVKQKNQEQQQSHHQQQQQQHQQQQHEQQQQQLLQKQETQPYREQLHSNAEQQLYQHMAINVATTRETETETATTITIATNNMYDIKNICNACPICKINFPNNHLKEMHQMLMHVNDENIANTCHQLSLNGFKESATSVDTLVSCSSSSVTHSSKQIINDNYDYEYKCYLCMKAFRMKGSLRVHLKVVHSIGLPDNISNNHNNNNNNLRDQFKRKTQITEDFSSELKTIKPLRNDFNFYHSIQSDPQQLTTNQSIEYCHNQEVTNSEKIIDEQTQIANNNNNNSNNNNNNSNNNNNRNDSNFNAAKLNAFAIENFNPKIWECDICSKCFTTKYFLKKHKRLHTGEMPYTCELCARTFTFQQSYHKHLLYHSDEKPHVCQTCGRPFKELSTLHNHERIHSGEKPFKCDICGKCFRQRVSFLVHTRIHTGVMPYKCELCEKSFRYKVSQRTHKCQMLIMNNNNINTDNISDNHNVDLQQNKGNDVEQVATLEDLTENILKTIFKENACINDPEQIAGKLSQQHQQQQQIQQSEKIRQNCLKVVHSIPTINDGKISPMQGKIDLDFNSIQDRLSQFCENDNQEKLITTNNCLEFEIAANNSNDDPFSPIEQLQNMRLYSPQLLSYDDNDLTRFLLDHTNEFVDKIL